MSVQEVALALPSVVEMASVMGIMVYVAMVLGTVLGTIGFLGEWAWEAYTAQMSDEDTYELGALGVIELFPAEELGTAIELLDQAVAEVEDLVLCLDDEESEPEMTVPNTVEWARRMSSLQVPAVVLEAVFEPEEVWPVFVPVPPRVYTAPRKYVSEDTYSGPFGLRPDALEEARALFEAVKAKTMYQDRTGRWHWRANNCFVAKRSLTLC